MRNLHADVTARILAQLEAGVAPWSRDWHKTAGNNVAQNAVSGRPYSGVNTVLLWFAMDLGYPTPRFLTFKQAKDLGGNVKKGEHGFKVYFVSRITSKKDKDSDGNPKAFTMLKEYVVFNVAQCENLPARLYATAVAKVWNSDERDATADEFLAHVGAKVTEGVGAAFYRPGVDDISIPAFSAFNNGNAFYATMFHELGHWTGHKTRLDRDFSGRFGSQSYAAEELVAELTSAYLCAEFGFDNRDRHAAYIQSWIQLLKSDHKAFFTAAAAAQKAADFLRGKALAETETELEQAA